MDFGIAYQSMSTQEESEVIGYNSVTLRAKGVSGPDSELLCHKFLDKFTRIRFAKYRFMTVLPHWTVSVTSLSELHLHTMDRSSV